MQDQPTIWQQVFRTIRNVVLVFFLGCVGLVGLMMFLESGHQEKQKLTRCQANLNQLAKAVKLYSEDFGAHPPLSNPDFFTTIYNAHILNETMCYRCPASNEDLGTTQMFHDNNPAVTDYECRTLPIDPKLPSVLLFWEKKPFHAKGRNVVFGKHLPGEKNWRVWQMQVDCISEAQFAELVKQARK